MNNRMNQASSWSLHDSTAKVWYLAMTTVESSERIRAFYSDVNLQSNWKKVKVKTGTMMAEAEIDPNEYVPTPHYSSEDSHEASNDSPDPAVSTLKKILA